MSLFSRRKDDRSEASPPTPPARAEEAATDLALDSLANILRAYGGNGFDVEGMEAAELARLCDAWARHILTGTPPPLGQKVRKQLPTAELLPPKERHWPDLQQFIRNHRRNEQSSVLGSAEQMRGLITEVASGLRSAMTDDVAKDDLVSREMSALSAAVQSNSLQAIRTQVNRTIDLFSSVVRQRQARYEAQLRSMSQRVRSLRADLTEVRSKVDLDPLTQVHNRGAFDNVLAKQVDVSFLSLQPLALLMIDLDHFKRINDTHGHPGGDLALKVAADTIARVFSRRSDFIARYGGEEFAVIVVDVAPSDLQPMSERLLSAIRDLSIDYRGTSVTLTCSIGVAAYRPENSVEELLQRADRALYQAKNSGRDRAIIADP